MPLQVGDEMILRGCAWMSRKRIFSSSRWIARWVWSRPVCLPSACQAFTATWPLVSGASISTTSQASMSVSIFGMPQVAPSARTTPLSSPSCFTSAWVFQAMPLPPLPTLPISGPSAVKRL